MKSTKKMNGVSASHNFWAVFFALAVACAMALAMAGCAQGASGSASASSASESAVSASSSAAADADAISYTLKVDATQGGQGILYDGAMSAKNGDTVYQGLLDSGLDVAVESGSGSAFVDGIGGVVASKVSPNSGWLYTVNGEVPSVGASDYALKDGDAVVWTFYEDATKVM